MKPIDAISMSDALDTVYNMDMSDCANAEEAVGKIYQAIGNLPGIDAVQVVYCKDCSHARPLNLRELMIFEQSCFVCTSPYGAGTSFPKYETKGKVVFPKGFCSYAHRRTNGR